MSTKRTDKVRATAGAAYLRLTGRVGAQEAGMRLDEFLARHVPEDWGPVSRSTLRRAILAGAVTVDRLRVRRPSWTLDAGSRVVAHVDERRLDPHRRERDAAHARLDVVFDDEWLLVVNKPPGLPLHATADAARPNLVSAVRAALNVEYVGVHQRLDRDTSGLVLFTKKPEANRALAALFASHSVDKIYVALVARPARLPLRRWTSETPIVTDGAPQASSTEFRILKVMPGALLVEARPRTGRKHQIRIHLAAAGLPIIGDRRYGWTKADAPPAFAARMHEPPRVMLHASALELRHPMTGAPLSLKCSIPPDFAALLSAASSSPRRP